MESTPSASGYRALYRSWRPRRFADLVGQEHVARTIRNAVAQGRAAHAYLFCGPRGTGKTSTARILAKALNCERPADGEPCGACDACVRVEAEEFLDIIEIDAASNRGIDEMRDLREKVRYAPSSGRCKVYIVDEVHMLTDPAWNAFLKTLEEPPEHTVFALATTDPHKVPLTVLSRCQRFDFRRPTAEQIAGHLRHVCEGEGLPVAAEALDAIARRSEGGIRDALSLLDQGLSYAGPDLTEADVVLILGAAENEVIDRLLDLAASGDARAVLAEVEQLYLSGKDFPRVARDLAQAARGRVIRALDAGPAGGDIWLRGAELLTGVEAGMRRTGEPRLLLEVTLLRWIRDAGTAGSAVRDTAPAPVAAAAQPRAGRPAAAADRRSSAGAAETDPGRGAPPAPVAAAAQPRAASPVPAGGRRPPAAAAETKPPAPPGPTPEGMRAAAVPAPASLPQRADEPLTLEALTAAWPQVVAALGRIERVAQTVFRGARPVSLEDGKLTLVLQPGYHLVAPSKRPALEKALLSVVGASPGMEFVADQPTAASAPRQDGGGVGGSPHVTSLHEALDVFQGDEADPPGFEAGGGDAGLW